MKLHRTLAGLGLATAITLGGTAAAFAQGTDPAGPGGSGPGTGQRPKLTTEERCEKAPDILERLENRTAHLTERLAKLEEAKQKAIAEGNTELAERIQQRIDKLTERLARVEGFITKVQDWVAENC